MPEPIRVPLPGGGAAPAVKAKSIWSEVARAIIAAIAKLLLARVQKEFDAAEKKLPAPPDGKPILGLPDEFAGKLVRKHYGEIVGSPLFVEAVVEEVVAAVKSGHGPTRRNRVALS